MPYQINPSVMQENHRRAHAPEMHYVARLRERGLLVEIDNVVVDAEQLVLRSFACDSSWCLRCTGEGGARRYKGSCCTDLQVDVTENEVERLRELGRLADQRLSLTASDPMSLVLRRIREDKFTEVVDRGDLTLRHLSSGRCALSWIDGGHLHCAINTLCARLGADLTYFKPEPCFLFPLHYVEFEPGRLFFTLISAETREYIGADVHTSRMRCLRRPHPDAPPAYQFLRGELTLCLGEEFYERFAAAAEPILAAALARQSLEAAP